MKKIIPVFFLLLITSTFVIAQHYDDLQEKILNRDRLKLFPSYKEGKNYFFLQSINDTTQIVIGDFTQIDKKIILIVLNPDYTTIKSVVEYMPEKKQLRFKKSSDSKFFTTDIVKLKRDIITGAIFKGNNTEDMKSFGDLEKKFSENDASSIFPEVYGFSVKLTEEDDEKLAALYTFGKTVKGYYLQFKTISYMANPVTRKNPVLKYSVYSKNTHDPIIQEYVDKLFEIRKPSSSYVK